VSQETASSPTDISVSTATSPGPDNSPGPDKGSGFLRIEGLSKSFTDRPAVNDLNIAISQGEFVAFLGPSGCGKTTTLRMIAGFIKNDAGAIYLDGRRIDQLPSRRRETAMVFQDYALFPNMTIFDNVAFGLRMRKTPKQEIARRVREVLDVVQLSNVEKKYPKELSGGMRQRVALARAIVVGPRVLLLDEPLSNLDAKLRKTVRRELREIHERLGITTVLVTHDLEEAFSLGDRVVVMNAGQIEQYSTPQEIYSQPANTFVADFVGHTNLVEGQWERTSGARGLFRGAGLELATATNPPAARAGVYTVPPNNIQVSIAQEKPVAENVVRAVVQDIAFLGSFYSLRAKAGDAVFNVSVVTGSLDETELIAGREIWLYWSAAEGDCVSD
jgi:putative spermidine/putrescine transport system ATP-binding protein